LFALLLCCYCTWCKAKKQEEYLQRAPQPKDKEDPIEPELKPSNSEIVAIAPQEEENHQVVNVENPEVETENIGGEGK